MDFDRVRPHVADTVGLRHEAEAVEVLLHRHIGVGAERELEDAAEHVRESAEFLTGDPQQRLRLRHGVSPIDAELD